MAVPSRVDGAAGTADGRRRSNFFGDLLHFSGFPGNLLISENMAALLKTNGLISFQNSRIPSVSGTFSLVPISGTFPVCNRWIFPLAVGKWRGLQATGYMSYSWHQCFSTCANGPTPVAVPARNSADFRRIHAFLGSGENFVASGTSR